MKNIILLISLVMAFSLPLKAQDYDLSVAGQGANGNYYVTITAVLDKKQNKETLDHIKQYCVEGIMLKGASGSNGYPGISALISNPSVFTTKSEFFDAFNREKKYSLFANVERESVVVTELPKKKYEVSARVVIDKESLIKYLQDCGIIKGFDSLW